MTDREILARFCRKLVALDMDIFGLRKQAQDAEPEGEPVGFRSMENGQAFPIFKGQTIKEAAENFIDKKQAEKPKERTAKEYRDAYEKIPDKKGNTVYRINEVDKEIAKYQEEMAQEKTESGKDWYKQRLAEFEKDKDKLIKDYVDKHEGNYHEEQALMSGYGWENNNSVYRYYLNGEHVLSNEELKKYGSNITSEERLDELFKATQKSIESLSPAERQALNNYTSEWGNGSYKDINTYLREGGSGDAKKDEAVKNISSALSRPIGVGVTVQRGVGYAHLPIDKKTMAAIKRISSANFDKPEDQQKIIDALKGKELVNESFTSTSTGSLLGYGDRPVKFIFKVPPEAHGLDITNLSGYGSESKFEAVFGALTGQSKALEDEILFDKGMRYKIDDVKFVFKPGYGKGKTAKPKGQVVLVATVLTD